MLRKWLKHLNNSQVSKYLRVEEHTANIVRGSVRFDYLPVSDVYWPLDPSFNPRKSTVSGLAECFVGCAGLS